MILVKLTKEVSLHGLWRTFIFEIIFRFICSIINAFRAHVNMTYNNLLTSKKTCYVASHKNTC